MERASLRENDQSLKKIEIFRDELEETRNRKDKSEKEKKKMEEKLCL